MVVYTTVVSLYQALFKSNELLSRMDIKGIMQYFHTIFIVKYAELVIIRGSAYVCD